MAIRRFFDKEVVVYRLKDITGDKEEHTTTATVDTMIQRAPPSVRQVLGMVEEEVLVAYFEEEADVKKGDKLVDEDGNEYRVIEIVTKDYAVAINRHKEAYIVEYNA